MEPLDPVLAVVSLGFAAGWAWLGALRYGGGRSGLVLRGLLGGVAAFGLAHAAYQLLLAAGSDLRWEQLFGGGWGSLRAAALIGLVEEGAKLAGLALAVRAATRPGAVMGTTIAVGAGFAALETALTLSGGPAGLALSRAAFAPVAHAVLAVPLGFGLAVALRRGPRAWLTLLPLALALSAALHGAGDLALAAPRFGRLGFALAMCAPVVGLFLHLRWRQPVVAAAWAAPYRPAPSNPSRSSSGLTPGSRPRKST